ncbi:M56 family metallopeptidase [Pedobacter sp. AW1-32]|uniref:M56 family metallopeptidase n=1 Tax=Pedobacter sp. AW1-32 TaxID=3383026 RepID=UPI003FEDD388
MQINLHREVNVKSIVVEKREKTIAIDESTKPLDKKVFQQLVQKTESFNWFSILTWVYTFVACVLLTIALFRLSRLLSYLIGSSKNIDGLKIINKTSGFTNCSFFSYVFVNKNSLTKDELMILIRHEKVHAEQFHSLDKLILLPVKILLWFSPVIYFYDSALEQVHEYEADEKTAADFGSQKYANLLLKLAVELSGVSFVHNLVKSPIKDRIKMLFNDKSNKSKKMSYWAAFPLCFVLVWWFSVQIVYAQKTEKFLNGELHLGRELVNEPSNSKNSNSIDESRFQNKSSVGVSFKGKPLTVTEEKPEFLVQDKIDTSKVSKVAVFKIISYTHLEGNKQSSKFYMENAVVDFFAGLLKAEYVEYDRADSTIVAKKASLLKNGNLIKADQMNFNFARQTVGLINDGEQQGKVFQYRADTVRFSKDKSQIMLLGRAQLTTDKGITNADKIVVNTKVDPKTGKSIIDLIRFEGNIKGSLNN